MEASELDINRFVLERGRLPRIGDEIPPWKYRGWLLWYVQMAHEIVPETGNRWGYWMRTLEAGELLPEKIPKIEFDVRAVGQSNSPPVKNIFSALKIIDQGGRLDHWEAFREFIRWLAWGLATSRLQPDRLAEDVQEQLYRTFNLQPWLEHPGDHLGEFIAFQKSSGWNPTGFYPTPHSICEVMVEMTIADSLSPDFLAAGPQGALVDGRDIRLATVCDPCVGTGRMLLHAAQYSFCLYGQDIDALVAEICKINGALYAPWLAFPMPAEMLERCRAVRYQLNEAGDELPPLIISPSPPTPAEVAAIVEAVDRARELAQAVTVEEMAMDQRGQGLLFGETPKPKRGRQGGSRGGNKNAS